MTYCLQWLVNKYNSGEKLNFIFFWDYKEPAPYCWLSQFYPSPFQENGVQYSCAEQWMMVSKARLFKDFGMGNAILEEINPRRMQRAGQYVEPFNQKTWDNNKAQIVIEGNFLKFSQNPELKSKLLETGNSILVEASPYDPVWGIQLEESNPDSNDPNKWQGGNLLGFCLMEVREQLKRKEPE